MVDYLRKMIKQVTASTDESVAISENDPQRLIEHRLDIERLHLATQQLTETQRKVISLRFARELSMLR